MPTKKITITVREGHLPHVRKFAREAGVTTSAWLRQMVEHELCIRCGLAAMREWDAEDGPLTEEELASAEAQIAMADAQFRANGKFVELTPGNRSSAAIPEYGGLMATKKITITMPEEDLEQIRHLAEQAGMPLSTWITKVVEHKARVEAGLEAMREWEAEHGAITEEELGEVHAELAKADAELRAARAPIRPGQVA